MEALLQHILAAPDWALAGEIVFKLVVAAALSGVLGFERESRGRSAGLRTHMIVCLGSTTLMIVSGLMADEFNRTSGQAWLDQGRIAAGIITGIGFLGAGTIVHTGLQQRGLTTAAMIWMVAALGVAVGSGFYLTGALLTVFTLVTIVGLRIIERQVSSHEHLIVRIRLPLADSDTAAVEARIARSGARHAEVMRLHLDQGKETAQLVVQLDIRSDEEFHRIAQGLRTEFANAQQLVIER